MRYRYIHIFLLFFVLPAKSDALRVRPFMGGGFTIACFKRTFSNTQANALSLEIGGRIRSGQIFWGPYGDLKIFLGDNRGSEIGGGLFIGVALPSFKPYAHLGYSQYGTLHGGFSLGLPLAHALSLDLSLRLYAAQKHVWRHSLFARHYGDTQRIDFTIALRHYF